MGILLICKEWTVTWQFAIEVLFSRFTFVIERKGEKNIDFNQKLKYLRRKNAFYNLKKYSEE